MLQNRFYYLLLLFAMGGCIEEYPIGNIKDYEASITVDGWVYNHSGEQEIKISYTTPLTKVVPDPISNCRVEVHDDAGNVFVYAETTPGTYVHFYRENDIQAGRLYSLTFSTPENKIYESEQEKMLPAPQASNAYYELEEIPTSDENVNFFGLQFYTDVNIQANEAKYFRIEIVETYEFHSLFREVFYLDSRTSLTGLSEDSIEPICFITKRIPDIFLIESNNVEETKVPGFPLHFVSNETQRLLNGYSLELRFLPISENAYQYWNNHKQILEESGGLFETQPPASYTNITCINDPDELVVGFFGVSGISSSRLMVKPGVLPEYQISPYCGPSLVQLGFILSVPVEDPMYFIYYPDPDGLLALHLIEKRCFNCLEFYGSTIEKPDYWIFK